MKYVKTEPTPYLINYKLEGKENKFSRMSMYNKLVFFNMGLLTSKKPKTVIITNEVNTGGVIISGERFINKVLNDLENHNKDYKFIFNKQAETRGLPNKLVYCSFDMTKNN